MFKLIICRNRIYLANITCSKSTIKSLEKGVKHVKVNNKKHQNDVNDVILVFLLTLNILHTFASVYIIYFEKVNVRWTMMN